MLSNIVKCLTLCEYLILSSCPSFWKILWSNINITVPHVSKILGYLSRVKFPEFSCLILVVFYFPSTDSLMVKIDEEWKPLEKKLKRALKKTEEEEEEEKMEEDGNEDLIQDEELANR